MPNADIKLVTIMRRWLDENFPYKFDYAGFGLASILRDDTVLHVHIHAKRHLNDHEHRVCDLYIGWCTNIHFVLMGHEIKRSNIFLVLSDPQFFEKCKCELSKYLTAFEEAGYVLPRRNSYSV